MFKFRTLNNDPELLPIRLTEFAGAYDIKCSEDVVLKPYEPQWVSTGLWITEYKDPDTQTLFSLTGNDKLEIPPELTKCYFLRIYPRSSFFKKQIYYHPGIIDQDFRDEIKVGMEWQPDPRTMVEHPFVKFPDELVFPAKTRIAQIQAHLFYKIDGGLEMDSERKGGFGSTEQ